MTTALILLVALVVLVLIAERVTRARAVTEPDDEVPAVTHEAGPDAEEPGSLLDYLEFGGTKGMTTKEGKPSTHKRGVLYQGPWQVPHDGFQEHTRRCARALQKAGVPVHLRGLAPQMLASADGSERDRVERSVEDMTNASIARYSVQVQQVVANTGVLERLTSPSPLAAQVYTPEQWGEQFRSRVLYTVYERWPIPKNDARALSMFGQVWVACERDAEEMAKAGVSRERVRVIPIPFAPDDPLLALRDRVCEPGPTRFYHIGKWEPRKAGDRIIGAFLRAFRPGEAKLYLKCSLLDVSFDGWPASPEAAIAARLRDPVVKKNGWDLENGFDDIVVETGILPAEEIRKIHAWGDVYVTLSRGEGFDMPSLDSKIAGNLLVYTPSGGPQDFASIHDVRVEPTGSVPAHSVYAWGPEARYLDFDVSDAATAMRAAHDEVQTNAAAPWRKASLEGFTQESVGRRMREALQELVGPDGKLVEP